MSPRTFGRGPVAAGLAGGLVALSAGAASATLVFTETVTEADIDRGATLAETALGEQYVAVADTLLGNYTRPGVTDPIDNEGKSFTTLTTDLSSDDDLAFVVQAPAGHRFRVHTGSSLDFRIQFLTLTSTGVTLTADGALTLFVDGVPKSFSAFGHGVNPTGEEFFMEGGAFFAAGTTFTTLAFAFNYSADLDNNPITIASGTQTLDAADVAHVSFTADVPGPAPTYPPIVSIEPVPEPAAFMLLASAATLALAGRPRRRQPRRVLWREA